MPNWRRKILDVELADIDAVEQNLAALNVVEAQQELNGGGFAGAGVSDDGDGLAGVARGRRRRGESNRLRRDCAPP